MKISCDLRLFQVKEDDLANNLLSFCFKCQLTELWSGGLPTRFHCFGFTIIAIVEKNFQPQHTEI